METTPNRSGNREEYLAWKRQNMPNLYRLHGHLAEHTVATPSDYRRLFGSDREAPRGPQSEGSLARVAGFTLGNDGVDVLVIGYDGQTWDRYPTGRNDAQFQAAEAAAWRSGAEYAAAALSEALPRLAGLR